ncbi:sugar 3,4-ketoisomerase [Haliea salexigens]|uniref:sugar 3,4-ketoisomerase n=1 Tax=Haliea salexigens TaxID=287487 RepID=UPI00041575CF|nr:FdtA/QdtA family cupin domain-containing protein [Haliea salexigens]
MTLAATTQDCWFDGKAHLLHLQRHRDARGCLLPLEFDQLPFAPQRLFTVSEADPGTQRGGHGHRRGQQLLVCLAGRIDVALQYGSERAEVTLDSNGPALLVSAGVWGEQTYVEQHSVLLVLASDPYDASSYFLQGEPAP